MFKNRHSIYIGPEDQDSGLNLPPLPHQALMFFAHSFLKEFNFAPLPTKRLHCSLTDFLKCWITEEFAVRSNCCHRGYRALVLWSCLKGECYPFVHFFQNCTNLDPGPLVLPEMKPHFKKLEKCESWSSGPVWKECHITVEFAEQAKLQVLVGPIGLELILVLVRVVGPLGTEEG